MFETYNYTFLERFLKYVQIDTQSDPHSPTSPSTMKQKDLGHLLVQELKEMNVECEIDEYGYVYATIPSNSTKNVPAICFCSHMDTSPDSSGANVKPIIHRKYQGADLILPDDPGQVIRLSEHPDLRDQIGNDIITASGTTLLGADNKAGVAEIMDAVHFFVTHPEVKHGAIKVLFTPDEEIGRGVDHVDLKKLGASFGYTIDGESCGSMEDETFSADAAVLKIKGVSTHPGFAKGKMENAVRIASEIVARLPKDKMAPESTSGKKGFIHPVGIRGNVEEAVVEFIIREFADEELKKYERILEVIAEEVFEKYPGSTYEIKITPQYRNMKKILDQFPQVVEYGKRAIERSGLTPRLSSIRGGTDGSRLSFMGLPCPNLFAGEHAFHSKQEWVSVQDMQKAVQTIVNVAIIWEEETV